jgi:hypothetical protein
MAIVIKVESKTVCSPALPCGTIIATFKNVNAFSNGEYQCGKYSCAGPPYNGTDGPYGPQYQCTELVERFYYQEYNILPKNWNVLSQNICSQHPKGVYIAAIPYQPPLQGDVWVNNPPNDSYASHVAIVTEYIQNYQNRGPAVRVIEQNANVTGKNIYPVFSPHNGCFLTANYTHSCENVAPNDDTCGWIGTQATDDPLTDDNGNEKLSIGAIIGIVLGCVTTLVITGILMFYLSHKCSTSKTNIQSNDRSDSSIITKNPISIELEQKT